MLGVEQHLQTRLTDILSLPFCETSLFWAACPLLGASSILLPSERRSLAITGVMNDLLMLSPRRPLLQS